MCLSDIDYLLHHFLQWPGVLPQFTSSWHLLLSPESTQLAQLGNFDWGHTSCIMLRALHEGLHGISFRSYTTVLEPTCHSSNLAYCHLQVLRWGLLHQQLPGGRTIAAEALCDLFLLTSCLASLSLPLSQWHQSSAVGGCTDHLQQPASISLPLGYCYTVHFSLSAMRVPKLHFQVCNGFTCCHMYLSLS